MTFFPTPWGVAKRLYKWDINDHHGLPLPTSDMTILHPSQTSDKQTRLEISPRCAMLNRRTFGFVVDIQEGNCENTKTPYNLTIVVRLLFTGEEDTIVGLMWARITAFSSNLVTISGESIMEGTILEGILVATFGEHLTATFGSFEKSSIAAWRQEGAGPPFVAEERDLDPWTWSPIPLLGDLLISNHRLLCLIYFIRLEY